ncbi:type VII secretion target [Micromonospora sp. HM5-17]|jgi:hypothetical protein|uniref:type VII secretion target n=1 Tax=Micromonospora sp. HM5-17 TaxID=2487710 RepID=UPI000F460451|nr:type VII secretion target [Micromonospora sp. HM5-17]ROT34230.1 ESX-1 secretion-associated protein [Micromonospora sp. HM5-17]
MAGGESFQVTAADLVAHAGHLDQIAGDLAMAKQAGETTRPGPEAYGRLCVIVPSVLGHLHSTLVEGIGAAVDSVRDTAARVRSAADNYRESDDGSSARFNRIRSPG